MTIHFFRVFFSPALEWHAGIRIPVLCEISRSPSSVRHTLEPRTTKRVGGGVQRRRARKHATYLPRVILRTRETRKKISVGRVIYYLTARRRRESFLNSSTTRVVRRSALETSRITMITVAIMRRARTIRAGGRQKNLGAFNHSCAKPRSRRRCRYFRNGTGGRGQNVSILITRRRRVLSGELPPPCTRRLVSPAKSAANDVR